MVTNLAETPQLHLGPRPAMNASGGDDKSSLSASRAKVSRDCSPPFKGELISGVPKGHMVSLV